jgi:hypothetical protein
VFDLSAHAQLIPQLARRWSGHVLGYDAVRAVSCLRTSACLRYALILSLHAVRTPTKQVSHFVQATTSLRESRGIALLCFYTSTIEEGRGQRHALAALTPGKTRYPLYRRLGGPQVRSVQVGKISLPPGFDPRTVQPVASRYTD